jgi:hypothetical protein
VSATSRAIGPSTEIADQPSGRLRLATRPGDGRSPTTPHKAAGMRSEPPVSDPVHKGSMPVASAAADPPDDPPAFRLGSKGLPVAPQTGLRVLAPAPMSGTLVLAVTIAPARAGAQPGCCRRAARDCAGAMLPLVESRPSVSCRSLTPSGRPCSGRQGLAAHHLALGLPALARARSKSVAAIALTAGLIASMRAMQASISSTGDSWRGADQRAQLDRGVEADRRAGCASFDEA